MADFKTALERLSRQELDFDSVARNLDKLLSKKPQAAVTIMDQLKEAVTGDVIDSATYAKLKAVVTAHLEAPVSAGDDEESTIFAGDDGTDGGILDITGGGDVDDSEDATQIVDSTAAATPMSGQTTGIDFDLTSDAGSSTSSEWPAGSTQTGQTGTDWAQPDTAAPKAPLGPGSVLRGRFQLDVVLGVGGMGSVYLGSDLIKVRAKDKKPQVALKVLNEDFKQHPDSFIALQREASRQQKLAHPNIATVYDFDQTEDGLAFLVMEVLEGEPLNDFIKKIVRPKGGLPFEEALPMVQGLGQALVYAHDHHIVHSDFKPGNCFITTEGVMKVLDFGIARAVKAPGAAEGETTIFDPGKLGALTPAYASVEMLEGEEPDTRDDIYALACVAYELLTGKHPFNKIPANKARASGLVPEPIKTISRKQWRGLERGLAYLREDRSQNTAEFLEEFEGATSPLKNPLIMVPAVVALTVLAGFFPAKNYLDEQDTEGRIERAQSGDAAQIESVLGNLVADDLDQPKRDRILNQAKDQILAYFDDTARQQIDMANGRFDFIGAKLTLQKARSYAVYADSSKLLELQEHISESENRLFNEQFEKFNTALENGSLLAIDGEDDIHDAMEVVRQVDPNHPMLQSRRLPGAFAVAINGALENEDYEFADELGRVGVSLIPGNANLDNLTDKIAGAKDRAETNLRILEAVAEIQQAADSGDGLAAYVDVAGSIARLAAADPGNEVLENLRKTIGPQAAQDIGALESSKNWGKSALIGGDFNSLLRGLGLHDVNARANVLGNEFDTVLGSARAAVTAAVANDQLTPTAVDAVAKLAAIAPRNSRTQNARDQLARAYLTDAQLARAGGDFAAAKNALDGARSVETSMRVTTLIAAEAARIDAESNLDNAALGTLTAERAGRFDSEYATVSSAIAALATTPENYTQALAGVDSLQALSPTDPRLTDIKTALASAVRNGAGQMGQAGQWDDAVNVTREALVSLPQATSLSGSLDGLEAERKRAVAEQQKQLVADSKRDIEQLLLDPTADRNWRAAVRQKIETIAALGEPDDTWIKNNGTGIAAIYVERATAMRAAQRLAEGANLLADAERIDPNVAGLSAERDALAIATEAFEKEQEEQARLARVDGLKQTFETQARANDVVKAAKSLASLRAEIGDQSDPFVTRDAPRMLSGAYFKLATVRAAATDYEAALKFAKACAEIRPVRSECTNAVSNYTVDGNKQILQKTFNAGGEFDVTAMLGLIAEVQVLDEGVFGANESEWAGPIASRLNALKSERGTAANDVLQQARELFEGNTLIASIDDVVSVAATSVYARDISAAMDKAFLGQARDLLKKANASEGSHPDIVVLKATYNARVGEAKSLYETYKTQYKAKEYESALATMEKALSLWADSSTFRTQHARVVAKLGPAGAIGDPDRVIRVADALPSTNPCTVGLAGHGKRKKGTCFYFVSANLRGPMMVVVPNGEGVSQPFAIGKYELTVGDYNRYCKLSRACEPINGQESVLPVTGITLEQAEAYVAWLSERTGLKYRLPSVDEWTYAANAGGDQPRKDFNCRVEQNGQLLKGQGTMGVNTGKANGWGLYNYVGNVQEWVSTGNGVSARGGAFQDAFSKCEIGLQKNHDGSADGATGFRVLLELDAG